jgi:hypothetical protein
MTLAARVLSCGFCDSKILPSHYDLWAQKANITNFFASLSGVGTGLSSDLAGAVEGESLTLPVLNHFGRQDS